MSQNGKVVMVEIEKIVPAPYNPTNRTSHKSIGELKDSIERVGIIQPLIITANFELVDGHRRLECARMLNMQTVPCIIRQGDRTVLFNEVNSTAKTLKRADDLFIYLAGGSMTGRSKAPISTLEKIIGREGLEQMAELGISPANIVSSSAHLFTLMNYKRGDWKTVDDPFVKKSVLWIIRNKQTFPIRIAAMQNFSSEIVRSCVENDLPLPVRY